MHLALKTPGVVDPSASDASNAEEPRRVLSGDDRVIRTEARRRTFRRRERVGFKSPWQRAVGRGMGLGSSKEVRNEEASSRKAARRARGSTQGARRPAHCAAERPCLEVGKGLGLALFDQARPSRSTSDADDCRPEPAFALWAPIRTRRVTSTVGSEAPGTPAAQTRCRWTEFTLDPHNGRLDIRGVGDVPDDGERAVVGTAGQVERGDPRSARRKRRATAAPIPLNLP